MNVGSDPTPGDACPTCASPMAPDQRYCLRCGHRRGDPRLPFMDAVVFMDAVRKPSADELAAASAAPPAAEEGSGAGITAQTLLVAVIATLVLAVGVGVLIGRSGGNSAPVAESPTKVIKIGGTEGGGEEAETAAATETAAKGVAKKAAKGGKAAKKKGAEAKEKNGAPELEEGENGGSKAAQEVLHTAPGVKEAKPQAQVGEKCEKGTAGCGDSGEFDGSFFE